LSYHYYGTDDLYLKYFIRFLRPGGQIGIVVPGLMRDFEGEVPSYLTRMQPSGDRFWDPAECFSFHTAEWWRRHWEQTQLVEVQHVDYLPEGWRLDSFLIFVYWCFPSPSLREVMKMP